MSTCQVSLSRQMPRMSRRYYTTFWQDLVPPKKRKKARSPGDAVTQEGSVVSELRAQGPSPKQGSSAARGAQSAGARKAPGPAKRPGPATKRPGPQKERVQSPAKRQWSATRPSSLTKGPGATPHQVFPGVDIRFFPGKAENKGVGCIDNADVVGTVFLFAGFVGNFVLVADFPA